MLQRALAQLMEDGDTSGVEALASGGRPPRPPRRPPSPAVPGRDDEPLADEEDVPLDNLPAALMAVNCADDPDRPDEEQLTGSWPACAPRTRRPRRCSGRTGSHRWCCATAGQGDRLHPGEGQGRGHPEDAAGRHPRRPATPYHWTEQTAKRLGPSAVVLDNRNEGHTGYGASECVHRKVDDFLLYGSLPRSGSSCGAEDEDRV